MSKSGKTHFPTTGFESGHRPLSHPVYGNIQLGKAAAKILIGMRLSGKTKAECDEWIEKACQEAENYEKEMFNNG